MSVRDFIIARILPLVAIILVGGGCLAVSAWKLRLFKRKQDTPLPEQALWSVSGELAMAMVLANGALYFALRCLRGFEVFASAAFVLACFTSIGSQYRYHQVIQQLDLADDTNKYMHRVHFILALGLFLVIGAQLALVLVSLRFTNQLS